MPCCSPRAWTQRRAVDTSTMSRRPDVGGRPGYPSLPASPSPQHPAGATRAASPLPPSPLTPPLPTPTLSSNFSFPLTSTHGLHSTGSARKFTGVFCKMFLANPVKSLPNPTERAEDAGAAVSTQEFVRLPALWSGGWSPFHTQEG